jgi:aspartate racemase
VAFEMARQLDAQGHRVEVLALLDVQAPGASEPIGDKALQELLARLARQMGATPGPIDLSTAEVAALPHDEAVEHMLDRLVAARALPVEVGRSEARRHLSVLLGHARAAVAYAPGRYPGQALLLTAAEGGAGGSVETWRGLIAGGVEAHVVPGDHESMLREPHVRALAPRLRARL